MQRRLLGQNTWLVYAELKRKALSLDMKTTTGELIQIDGSATSRNKSRSYHLYEVC